MTRFAGLDLDAEKLRLALFEGSAKKFSLVDYIEHDLEGESDEERAESARTVLHEVFERKENRGADVVSYLDARHTTLREISVPFTKDDQIAKTVRFEAEGSLHAVGIDDVIIEYLKCSESEESSRLLICAVEKRKLQGRLDELTRVGVDPVVLELDATALATAFVNTPLYSAEQNALLVEVGDGITRLVFIEQGRVVKIRSIWSQRFTRGRAPDRVASSDPAPHEGESGAADTPAGAADGTATGEAADDIARRFEAIERSLEDLDRGDGDGALPQRPFVVLRDADVDSLRASSADGEAGGEDGQPQEEPGGSVELGTSLATEESPSPPPTTETAVEAEPRALVEQPHLAVLARYADGDPIERLVTELERTFAAYVQTQSIDLVVVTGSRADELEVVPRLQERLEVDVTSFELGDSFPMEWSGDLHHLSRCGVTAIGLGLRAAGVGASGFDLRKEEFRFERRFAKLMPSVTLNGLLLSVLALIWGVSGLWQYRSYRTETERLLQRQAQIYERFFGEKARPGTRDFERAAERKLDRMAGKSARGRRGPRTSIKQYASPMAMLDDMMSAIRTVRPPVYPKFTDFDLDPQLVNSSKSTVKFVVPSVEEYQRIKAALDQSSKMFDTSGNFTASKDGNIEVTLTFRFKKSVIGDKGKRT